MVVNQLYLLSSPVVSKAVIDHNIKPIPPTPHVDQQCHRVSHVHGPSDPLTLQTIPRPYLHETLWRGQGEHHRVSDVRSEIATTNKAVYI